jgi:hypothetical protein
MRNLYVPLPDDIFCRLVSLAQAERRHPRDQASVLLTRELRRRPGDVPHQPCSKCLNEVPRAKS